MFPHEIKYSDDPVIVQMQIIDMCDKYKRRIERFMEIIKNKNIKKIFVRVTDKTEIPELLVRVLETVAVNFDFKHVQLDKTIKYSSWHKHELDWDDVFGL
jgi:predicted aspartyl protease